jgi:ribosomal protein S18 acetylase RimI-like enzyme
MKEIIFRQAVPADLPQLARLLEKLFTIEEDFQYSYDLQRQGLGLLLESKSATIIVAAENNRIVGMITGQLTISTAEGGRSLVVEDLYVNEQVRGRGIGRLLLHEVGKWANRFGARRMQLLADCNNHKALDFYDHIGWQQTKLICLRNYFSNGDT